jgi:hypothetical protein
VVVEIRFDRPAVLGGRLGQGLEPVDVVGLGVGGQGKADDEQQARQRGQRDEGTAGQRGTSGRAGDRTYTRSEAGGDPIACRS